MKSGTLIGAVTKNQVSKRQNLKISELNPIRTGSI
jgi:hypothetical protein